MAAKKMIAIPGSDKKPYRNAKIVAAAAADERVEVALRLRPRNALPSAQDMLQLSATPMAQLSHADYEQRYGADPKDFVAVRAFAKEYNLNVVRESAARRTVILAGTVVDLNRAFDVTLSTYAYDCGTYRGREGEVKVPANLA